jgi:DNA-binding transcriptional LysR family regulator
VELKRLQAFVTVARERSFTRAALRLHVSQSAVSQQVVALERELGARLLERTRRRVDLTASGAALYEHAVRILGEAELARRSVAAAEGAIAGELAIAASLTTAAYVLPPAVAALVAAHPDVRIAMRVENTEDVVHGLFAGEADIGFVEGDVPAEGLRLEELFADELVVIVPAAHRLAQRDELRLADLAAEPFVNREQGSGTRQIAEAALAEAGFDPRELRVVAELSGIDAIKSAVEAGLGLAIVSALTIRKELRLGTLVARPIDGIELRRPLSAAFAAGRAESPAARELVRLAVSLRGAREAIPARR